MINYNWTLNAMVLSLAIILSSLKQEQTKQFKCWSTLKDYSIETSRLGRVGLRDENKELSIILQATPPGAEMKILHTNIF